MDNTIALMDGPKAQTTIGLIGLLTSIFHDLYPVLTTIGAIAGSFLAIVGAYRVIRGWIKGKSVSFPDDVGDI